MSATTITTFEREILEELAGLRPPRSWGAAVGAALDELEGFGYITKSCTVTPLGLAELKGKAQPAPLKDIFS